MMDTPAMDAEHDRTTARMVSGVLRDVLKRPHRAHLSASGNVITIGPWDLRFRLGADGVELLEAVRPTGPAPVCWSLGCERDDWTLGPDSEVVSPMDLLSASERAALVEVIAGLDAEVPVDVCPMGPPIDAMERRAAREPKKKCGRQPKFESPWGTPDPVIPRSEKRAA